MSAGRRRATRGLGYQRPVGTERQLRAMTHAVRDVREGRLDNTQEVALTADGVATSTVVSIPRVRASSCVLLSPIDANAAAAVGSATGVWPECTKDTVTIHHPASALARSFRLAVFA